MSLEKDNSAVSLGRYMGNILGHVIQVKVGDALKCGDEVRCKEAQDFQKLFESEWNYRVNSACVKRRNALNRKRVQTIPLTEDLKKLRQFIISEMEEASSSLKKSVKACDWTRLAKFTMCRLILFNKRRRAEVKDLKVEDYEMRPNWKEEQKGEFEMAFSSADKLLAQRMDMVISAGKSRKNVDAYVLLTPDAKDAVDLLNRHREEVGVPTTNPYIFARLNSNSPLTGNTDLREIVDKCTGLKCPQRINSTALRKYIATVSQILDMTDPEVELLAKHLGHDVKTHKENYRLSHSTQELTKVSQLLLAVEEGQVNSWKGKKLSEICVDELPAIEDDEVEMDLEIDELPTVEDGMDLDTNELPTVEDGMDLDTNELPTVEDGMDLDTNGKRGKKRPWTDGETALLRIKFRQYFLGMRKSIHNKDLKDVQCLCPAMSSRSLAQIRSKLNNMKLGKSK